MNASASSEAFYAALLDDDPEQLYDRAPCGYLSTTPDGLIVKANATFADMSGYPSVELVGSRRFVDLLSPGGRIYHETHYAPMLSMQDRVREVAFDLVRSDGRRRPVLVNAVLERASDGSPRVVRVAVFDATQRREYEVELLAAKRRAELSEHRARALARTLQSTLIPPSPPSLPGLDVTAAYRPAGDGEEVGGDFYDVFQITTGDWVVVIGDVCGKGAEAAVVTGLVRYTVRALSVQESRPSRVLAALNDLLLRQGAERFATVVLARLRHDGDAWSVTLSAGGHPLPLLLSRGDQGPGAATAVRAVGVPGTLVGLLPRVTLTDHTERLAPGDLMVLYTDGVTEGRSERGFFGDDRLRQSVVAHRADPQPAESILAEVVDFQDGRPRDDIAVVAVRVPVPPVDTADDLPEIDIPHAEQEHA
ncbi:MAG: SpoIIE family protein phosphatase [Nocardioidaceae bacterium]